MMRSSSASYALMSDSLLLVLAEDRRRSGGEDDSDMAVKDEESPVLGGARPRDPYVTDDTADLALDLGTF